MKTWGEDQIPQKVQGMFEAVWSILGENQDLTAIKVSDITKRAGIGKGTAYEYFDTKEDLITNAMVYGANREYAELRQGLRETVKFQDQMDVLFDWLEENYKMHRCFEQVLKVSIGAASIPGGIVHQFRKKDCQSEAISIMDDMLQAAAKEGIVHGTNAFLNRTTLASLLLQYIMFLSTEEMNHQLTDQEIRERVYKEIVMLL